MSEPSQPPAQPTRDEQAHKLDQVLVETNGDRKLAAEVMGLKPEQVRNLITNTPALRVRWGGGERQVPETEVEVIDRKPIAAPLVRTEQAALALTNQEKSMAKNLRKLGFKSHEIESIQTMEEFAGQQFEQTLAALHGALIKSSMRLALMADHIQDTYLMDPGMDERDQSRWWQTYFRVLENLRLQNETAYKAALTRAVIKAKDHEQKHGKSGGNPGFVALTQVNIGKKE